MTEELLICVNQRLGAVSCGGRNAEELASALETGIARRGLDIEVLRIHCFGRCESGPNLRLIGRPFHQRVQLDGIESLLDALEREMVELAQEGYDLEQNF